LPASSQRVSSTEKFSLLGVLPPRSSATTKAAAGNAASSPAASRRFRSTALPRPSAISTTVSLGRNRSQYRENRSASGPRPSLPMAIRKKSDSGGLFPVQVGAPHPL